MVQFFNKKFFIIFLFPLILGGICVLSFQPFNFFFVNFFSLSLLFFLIIYVKKKSKSIYRKKPFLKNLFLLGTFYGFGFFFFGFYWIVYSLTFDDSFKFLIPFALILIPLFLSLFFSMPIVLVGSFVDKNLSSIFLISFAFSIADFLRSTVLTGFPWNLWLYSFSWSIESLQILSSIGTFSLNLLIITLFFIPSALFFKSKAKYFFVIFFILLFIPNYFYGSYKINSTSYNQDNKINFKIVSGGLNLSEFRDKKQVASRLIKFSDPDKEKKTIFVWPEGVFFGENFNNLKDIKSLFKKNFSTNHLIIFGVNTKIKQGDNLAPKHFNSMVVVDNNLNIISRYDKKKLVPFGEFLPFENFLSKVGIKKITPGYSSFSKGENNSVINLKFDKKNINFLALICYEVIFPHLAENKKNQFNFIINISEDAWFGESIGPYQHFSKAIFRSIDSETFIIRAANKGISAFISPHGNILKSLSPNEAGNIEMELPLLEANKGGSKKSLIFLLLLITFFFTFFLLRKFKL
tara:strand:- start:7070 stop:8629 length:1560 start_codon:yes stop_codon:yes gene_type:complete